MHLQSLLDILLPVRKSEKEPAEDLKHFKFIYYASGGFKGTNDEVLGWNSKRPGWVGFLSARGNRWYILKSDLTPESLEKVIQILEEKAKARTDRAEATREAANERLKLRREEQQKKLQKSILDGREEEITLLLVKNPALYAVANALDIPRGTLRRKLKNMGKL